MLVLIINCVLQEQQLVLVVIAVQLLSLINVHQGTRVMNLTATLSAPMAAKQAHVSD